MPLRRHFLAPLILLPLLLAPTKAWADSSCWNSGRNFYSCADNSSEGAVGVSAPILGDTLEANPANLPVGESPFGLEAVISDRSSPHKKRKVGISTVKGFDGLGFGIGAWSKNTFGAPDFPAHFLVPAEKEYRAYELKESSILGVRLGTTVVLPRLFFPKFVRFSLGGSLGFGQTKGDYSPQVGIVARIFRLGLGYSENFDRLSRELPRARISVYSAGIFLGSIYFSYSYSKLRTSLNRTQSRTYGIRIPLGRWTTHGAVKYQRDHRGERDFWYRGGLMRRIGKRLSVGYEYGHYRNSHSAVVQLFF